MINYYPFISQITARLFVAKIAIGYSAAGTTAKKVQPLFIIEIGSPPAN